MRRFAVVVLMVCGLLAVNADDVGVTYADNGDITVAPGGTVTIGPTGTSTNNVFNLDITFEDGGTIHASPVDSAGVTQKLHYLWRNFYINGTVTCDESELPAEVSSEFRRSVIATNGSLVISAEKSLVSWGSGDSERARNYPLYDVSNVTFAAGSGTIRLNGEVTLRSDPSATSPGVRLDPNGARLAIAGQGIVSNRTVWSSKRVSFNNYGREIVLLDESYIPDGVTPVFGNGKTFRIRPSDVVITNELVDTGNNAARVFWRTKEGSGVVPFDIDLNGGTLELITTRATYDFTGKIFGGGKINLQGASTRTIYELDGKFSFTNSTSTAGTVIIKKVNPGSILWNNGCVRFVLEEGALPASAWTMEDNGVTYVFVPDATGALDLSRLPDNIFSQYRATSHYLPLKNVSLLASTLNGYTSSKIGVESGAAVTLTLDGTNVPTVVGGDGSITIATEIDDDVEPALWLDASRPYNTETKGEPYYAPPGVTREGYDFGNIFFTNNYPFIESWYDVRGTERSWRLYQGRYYVNNQFQVIVSVYPYLAQGVFAGRTMTYITCGVNNAKSSSWSNDGPDTPGVVSSMGGNRRLELTGKKGQVTAIIMVFGSQLGGGIAMMGGGYNFSRNGSTLEYPICKKVPANTTIWLDGEAVDPTETYFNGGWQVVSIVGAAADAVTHFGQDRDYSDAGGQNYAEIMFFTNNITDAQRFKVEAYLAEKWGVSTYHGQPFHSPLRAEGRSGSIAVSPDTCVELRGTYAGNMTVDGSVSIVEPLPWTAVDVPTSGLVDWYDADDTNSLVLATLNDARNAVTRQYPHGKTQATASSGFYLWSSGNRMPFAVASARGLGAERTWIDYNHPDGFQTTSADGNVMRFIPWDKSGNANNAQSQTFRTLLVALDSCRGGGSILGSGDVGGGSGDFRKRDATSPSVRIWAYGCSDNVKYGTTRLNGVVVDHLNGLTGAPEVLSLTTWSGSVSALCVDTYGNTQSDNGVPKANGIIHGEMLMYDSVLDDDVRRNLEAYLMGKWTGVLPDGWSDLREATVTAGTGTVSAVAAKMPTFGDGFEGVVSMPDSEFSFTFDGATGAVPNAFVARGATLDLPAAVAVTIDCTNMQGASAASVPLFDVAAIANPVAWTLTVTNAGDRNLNLREENGKLLLELLPNGMTLIIR